MLLPSHALTLTLIDLYTEREREIERERERERLDLNLTQEESDIANGLLQYRRSVSLKKRGTCVREML